MTTATELLSKTKAKDDISILVNIIDQMADCLDYDEMPTATLPDATCHCKHWGEYSVKDVAKALLLKYKNEKGMEIPKEFLTSY